MYQYNSSDCVCHSDNPMFVEMWNSIVLKQKEDEEIWISSLRNKNIKAAHPDDGWVDRKENSVCFSYPQFNDGVNIGDIISLGCADKYRLVKVIDIKENPLAIGTQMRSYYFSEI